jgi:hypothetical protein
MFSLSHRFFIWKICRMPVTAWFRQCFLLDKSMVLRYRARGKVTSWWRILVTLVPLTAVPSILGPIKATLYSMLSFQGWWRQCTRSYLKAASTHCWRQHHSVTALATYTMTLFTACMPRRRNMDLLVPMGTSTRLNWIQCGFKHVKAGSIFWMIRA